MERFKDYKVKSESIAQLISLLDKIKNMVNESSKYSIEDEPHDKDITIIICKNEKYPTSRLILYSEPDGISIINVVPTHESGVGELTKEQYNFVLNQFVTDIINPIISNYRIYTVEETSENYEIEDIIPNSYEKLKKWMNGNPLSSHPLDTHRWYDFLISLCDNNEIQEMSLDRLEEYLKEHNWSAENIERRTSLYESQIDLLEYVRNH